MEKQEQHQLCMVKFIDLANDLKKEGHEPEIVSAALMSASGIYATYTAAGNSGALEPSGVEKVTNMYRKNLEHIQERKKAELTAAQNQE